MLLNRMKMRVRWEGTSGKKWNRSSVLGADGIGFGVLEITVVGQGKWNLDN